MGRFFDAEAGVTAFAVERDGGALGHGSKEQRVGHREGVTVRLVQAGDGVVEMSQHRLWQELDDGVLGPPMLGHEGAPGELVDAFGRT